MPLSNLAAFAALALTFYNEVSQFIKKEKKETDLHYITLSIIVSFLWLYYNMSNNYTIGKLSALLFIFVNSLLLIRCLQQRTGFLKSRTSPSK